MKNFLKNNWFKIIAIGILFGALWNHPIGYYQVLRWVITIVGLYSGYVASKHEGKNWEYIFFAIAILFNPIFPFYFAKETWQIIDVATAVVIFINVIKNKNA